MRSSLATKKGESKTTAHIRELCINLRLTDSLKSSSENPRTHSKKQIRKIARSIESFGFNVPVLVDDQGNIIAGHGRVEAAKLLGISHLPTISLAHLSAAETMAYMIADNRLSECGEWDERLLCQQLKTLSEIDLNFSIEATGFEMAEIDLRIDGAAPVPEGRSDPADFIPDDPTRFEVSQPGDLWQLEEHRILCGDALDATSYPAILEGQQAAMVFTDPPYNTRIAGYAAGHGKIQYAEFRMGSGEMTEAQHTDLLRESCTHLKAHSRDGSLHFYFYGLAPSV
jgi:ParB-like nuclease domain